MLLDWKFVQVEVNMMWGSVGLVAAMSYGAIVLGLLPKLLGWIGVVLVAVTAALAPTDHAGVGLTLLFWLIAASIALLKSGAAQRTLA